MSPISLERKARVQAYEWVASPDWPRRSRYTTRSHSIGEWIESPHICRAGGRMGVATLEFVIIFPLLVLMIATFFLLMSAPISRLETAIASQQKAFAQRYAERAGLEARHEQISVPSGEQMKRILGQARRGPVGEALIASSETRSANPILPIFEGVFGRVTVENYVLYDPWDFRTIKFEEHGRLTLSQRVLPFGVSLTEVEGFASLPSSSTKKTHDGNTSHESYAARQGKEETERGIREVEVILRDLRSRLQSLREATLVEDTLIAKVEAEIKGTERVLRQLQRAREFLKIDIPT